MIRRLFETADLWWQLEPTVMAGIELADGEEECKQLGVKRFKTEVNLMACAEMHGMLIAAWCNSNAALELNNLKEGIDFNMEAATKRALTKRTATKRALIKTTATERALTKRTATRGHRLQRGGWKSREREEPPPESGFVC